MGLDRGVRLFRMVRIGSRRNRKGGVARQPLRALAVSLRETGMRSHEGRTGTQTAVNFSRRSPPGQITSGFQK
jgi:hypothetical protein